MPLTDVDECAGDEHAERIRAAFAPTRTSSSESMRDRLAGLDHPVSRIHRTADLAGAPRVRIDLRFMGDNLVLEVTGTADGVTVEPFAVPEREDVRVAAVRRAPRPGTPTP
ncbi:hypothetical protein [Kitasatospora sp. DSM 101779]|uniref:hypothetical protein n=1 Tax=Kitasatospora sp. DSM 101779 TaxID=2853165 RepID=UPI0021D7FF18|nr:hypothetical protein [Kitasatospora sp. DSM 101779]MCU7821022.1 hypothetical protein [Kitasatospora sp. DSM 101779]